MRVVYFIAGCAPTPEERAAAEAFGAGIFQNAGVPVSFVEPCDAVAGLVPEPYARFPRATPLAAEIPAESAPASEPATNDTTPRPRGRRSTK